jgi:transposase
VLQGEVFRQSELLRSQARRIAELEGRELTQTELDLIDGIAQRAAEVVTSKAAADKRPRKPRSDHGPNPQPDLPREERLFELPPDERTCEVCDGQLEEMGVSEDSEEITVVERTYKVAINRRRKYRCRCNANVVTAPGPKRLIPGGRYSTEFVVANAVDKYADHLPLERQVARMARQGLKVSSSTLAEQIITLAEFLAPTYDAIRQELLQEPVLHVDETGWLLAPNGGQTGKRRHRKKYFTATVWGLCSDRFAHYSLLGSKSTEAGRSLLSGYRGYLVADGYQVYEILAKPPPEAESGGYSLVNCWAHVLRKFRELEETEPRSHPVLRWIQQLYEIDDGVEGPFPGSAEASAQRLALRREKAPPILDELRQWAFAQGGLRRSDLGRAITYTMKRWDNLTRFLEDGRIPLDNNRVERALRQPVLGRKNHFCSRSERGARATAILYSLVETDRINGIDPAIYLLDAANAAIDKPGAITLP